MNWYYFIFIWIAFMALLQNQNMVSKYEFDQEGRVIVRWKLLFAFMAVWPIIYLAVFSSPMADIPVYLSAFKVLSGSFSTLISTIVHHESGWGFVAFEIIEKMIFGSNPTVFRFILALIHIVPVVLIFRKYSENYLLSIYLFVASACHLGWMMNGLRQFMAVTIIFMATPLLVKKKYVSMILVVLLASTIHTSALIMLPVIFIVQGEIWNWKTISFSILSIIAMYVFSINIEVMDLLLVGTEYAGTAATWGALGDDGVNPIRVLVNAIPMLLSFVGRDIIKKDNNPIINICVNMSIITTGIYLIGMVTSGIMIGRLPIYTSLYNLILLPYLAKKVFAKDSIRLVNVLMVLLYFIYYFFET